MVAGSMLLERKVDSVPIPKLVSEIEGLKRDMVSKYAKFASEVLSKGEVQTDKMMMALKNRERAAFLIRDTDPDMSNVLLKANADYCTNTATAMESTYLDVGNRAPAEAFGEVLQIALSLRSYAAQTLSVMGESAKASDMLFEAADRFFNAAQSFKSAGALATTNILDRPDPGVNENKASMLVTISVELFKAGGGILANEGGEEAVYEKLTDVSKKLDSSGFPLASLAVDEFVLAVISKEYNELSALQRDRMPPTGLGQYL
jgi:hypothetical protein